MKKMITIWALLLITMVNTAFANDNEGDNRDGKAQEAFRKEFNNASDIAWEARKHYQKVSFQLNNQYWFAFYTPEGENLGLARNILSTQLPANLLRDLKEQFSNYWITDLFEMTSGGETSYYLTIENAGRMLVLKSEGTINWNIIKKQKKD
jgi:hypothetical protein